MLYSLNLYGQNDTTITKTDSLVSTKVYMEKQDNDSLLVPITLCSKNNKRRFDIYLGGSLLPFCLCPAPFKSFIGVGYFFNRTELEIKYSHWAWPLLLYNRVITAGILYYGNENNSLFYSAEVGSHFRMETFEYKGMSAEIGLGYIFRKNIGLYLSCQAKLTYLLYHDYGTTEKHFIPTLEISVGWTI